ncbi:T3SS tip complex protein Bsp22 [Bordetella bronchiseptica E014]|uniref:type III secretion system needle tip complex Bsp22 n=1 Tax=Bordetella bronchiseptica TaxID=518 RepID=UPI000459CBD7|nr:type III secretion system needle tip complex Bsp22 [Bordetella bronchiseptica]AUL14840.1 hypothetical protein BTL45_08055 [Bordetella bronchiseptica]AWP57936.1 hypothetical protein B7P02_08005 [Bordetella bronchiseptica]KAK74541.1 T3SS tip complex protein Bsp22 [Bordetella bronchiseptica CA90 BB02]KCV54404.1 T3SS tip complex protein Bsp22 [Bordetella bronchiseptica 7E71]KDC16314.1 T3SS tip complex protein Bsp22 [Bordetella bronchiseptica E014]
MSIDLGVSLTSQAGGLQGIDLKSMDIQTLMVYVQGRRAELLTAQMQTQAEVVQKANERMAQLNEVLSALSRAKAEFPPNPKPGDTIPGWDSQKISRIEVPLNDALRAAGLTGMFEARDGRGTQVVNGTGVMAGSTTYKELESAYTTVKGMLDTASNTQQMDMIRLQAASNKRNEAFEVMTNTEKRRSDLNSSITSNMR